MQKQLLKELTCPESTMLIIDYDRTLVDNSKQLLEETKKQLQNYQEMGGTIVLASGRPKSGLNKVSKLLKLDVYNGYIIGANGAEIYSFKKRSVIESNYIEWNQLLESLKKIEEIPIHKGIYTCNQLIVSGYTADLNDEANSNCLEIVVDGLFQQKIDSSKIILSNTVKDTHIYYDQVNELIGKELNVVKSSPRYIEITSKEADKGLGISKIKELEPHIKCVIGIGDSQNDLSMLQACDYKIAMGNATEEVKAISDIVIKANTEDGIGQFLREMLEK